MKVKIKQVSYTNQDLHHLVCQLDDFFLQSWGKQIAESYQSFHTLSQMIYCCVGYQQEAIGCGCLKEVDNQTIEIKRMFVLPQYRRHGYASQILHHLESIALQKGYHYSVLETGKEMFDNIQFYEKCGYHIVENYGEFIGDPICICMKKDLNGK